MKKYILFTVLIIFCFTPVFAQEPGDQAASTSISDTTATLNEKNVTFRVKPNIAILPFINSNAQAKEAEFGRTISAMLATAMRNETNFIVIERSELEEVIKEQVLETTGLTKEKTRKIGKLYNVEVILVGDVSLINNTLHIDARLIDTKSSKVVTATFGTSHDLTGIRQEVVRLAKVIEQNYLRQWMGRIIISSQPAGAEVYLEDKYIGLTNDQESLIITNLLEGSYMLKFIRGGYYDWEGEIAVLAKMERAVSVSLIAKPGSMNIYSEPAGAQIFLVSPETCT